MLQSYKAQVAVLLSKFATEAPKAPRFDSTPWPRIQGPQGVNARIGIVGAGPAGLDMAYKLKKVYLLGVYTEKTFKLIFKDFRFIANSKWQ